MISLDQIRSLDRFQKHLSNKLIQKSSPIELLKCFEALQSTCEDPDQVHAIYRELACIPVGAEDQIAFHEKIQALASRILDFALMGNDGKSVRTNFQYIQAESKTVSNLVEDIDLAERILPIPALSSSTLQFVLDYMRGSPKDLKELSNQFSAFHYLNIDLCKYFLPRSSLVIGPEKWCKWGLMEVSESNQEAFAKIGPDAIFNPVRTAESHVIFRIPPKVTIKSLFEMFCKRFPEFKVLMNSGTGLEIRHLENKSDGEWFAMSKRTIFQTKVRGYKKQVAKVQELRDGSEHADLPTGKQLIFALIGHFLNTGECLLGDRMCLIKDWHHLGVCIGRFSKTGLVIQEACSEKVGLAIRTL